MVYWLRMERKKETVEEFYDYDEGGRRALSDTIFSYMACGWIVTRLEIRGGSGVLW